MIKKIILKSNYTLLQKFILVVTSITLLYFFFSLISEIFFLGFEINIIGFIILTLLFVLPLFFILLLFTKNGILIIDKKLYFAKFISGKFWFKRQLDLNEITDITILSFKTKQNFLAQSFFFPTTISSESKGTEIYNNHIYLSNEKHTIKRHIITSSDFELAENAVLEINKILNFNYSNYNPRFGFGSRNRRK